MCQIKAGGAAGERAPGCGIFEPDWGLTMSQQGDIP
jgi:hypothetical protein